uniref:Sema domain-containing protein n=1 Tax=Mola mola TaxID=94237 RepID=A0A3Q3VSK7_MOLML
MAIAPLPMPKNLFYELKSFREDGIFNYSTMLMRDELGLLLLGAREAVYALDINDISDKKAAVRTFQETCRQCSAPSGCKMPSARSILTSLTLAFSMYVCGTNAFSPTCLRLEGKQEEGKGKCPFDPFQRYASLMVGNDLYSATSINFLGSEPVVLRSSDLALRTEFKSSWLSEPNFVYMDFVRESFDSPEGDDDKVYLFFSENAMEYDFYSKVAVSRVARVCKVKLTSLLLCMSQTSVVCAYSVSAIRDIFDKGKFKTPVAVETSHVKWVMYSGEVPVPRPGACINNVARKMGMNRSLDLPDKTLQFIRDRPLMDEAVHPLTGGPLLVKKGALLTRIVVDSVVALDGKRYAVMFIGTDNGYVHKAVNYDGEMFIIEEIQLYNESVPISTLRLSARKVTRAELQSRSEHNCKPGPRGPSGPGESKRHRQGCGFGGGRGSAVAVLPLPAGGRIVDLESRTCGMFQVCAAIHGERGEAAVGRIRAHPEQNFRDKAPGAGACKTSQCQ